MTADQKEEDMPEDIPNSRADDVIDIEEHATQGKPVPPEKHYRIRIDKTTYVVDNQFISGRALLTLAGKTPVEKYRVFEHLHGGQTKPIALDEKVDLAKPGLERFKTLPVDQTEGDSTDSPSRRQFKMPSRDSEYLDRTQLKWETVVEDKVRRLVVYGLPVPAGYSSAKVDLNLRIDPLYPATQIDMVYFNPPLSLTNGRAIPAISDDAFDGKTWQRWSRHRTAENPWRETDDGVDTHLECVSAWLQRELAR
jgi:hypothetical protein